MLRSRSAPAAAAAAAAAAALHNRRACPGPPSPLQLVVAVPKLAILWGLGLLVWQAVVVFAHPDNYLVHHAPLLQQATVPQAAVCLAAILATGARLGERLWWARARGLSWRRRQRAGVSFTTWALGLQGANVALWLGVQAYIWAHPCSFSTTGGAPPPSGESCAQLSLPA